MRPRRRCATPGCADIIGHARPLIPLCPSCRYIGRVGFFLGGLLAGAIAWVIR